MAKTQPLPLRLGFQSEPNTLKSCYQIVTKTHPFGLALVYTGAVSFTYWGTAPKERITKCQRQS